MKAQQAAVVAAIVGAVLTGERVPVPSSYRWGCAAKRPCSLGWYYDMPEPSPVNVDRPDLEHRPTPKDETGDEGTSE